MWLDRIMFIDMIYCRRDEDIKPTSGHACRQARQTQGWIWRKHHFSVSPSIWKLAYQSGADLAFCQAGGGLTQWSIVHEPRSGEAIFFWMLFWTPISDVYAHHIFFWHAGGGGLNLLTTHPPPP